MAIRIIIRPKQHLMRRVSLFSCSRVRFVSFCIKEENLLSIGRYSWLPIKHVTVSLNCSHQPEREITPRENAHPPLLRTWKQGYKWFTDRNNLSYYHYCCTRHYRWTVFLDERRCILDGCFFHLDKLRHPLIRDKYYWSLLSIIDYTVELNHSSYVSLSRSSILFDIPRN